MRALIIGGSGVISSAVVRLLIERKWETYVLNRGSRPLPEGAVQITADINDEQKVREKVGDLTFDVVCDFIGFALDDAQRDHRLFKDRTKQYIYVSSSSVYNKPSRSYIITEGTSIANPYWKYSQDKIACEEFLMKMYRESGFPVTIVRPGHTYSERSLPIGVRGTKGFWQVVKRILEEKPVIIQGDGTSLWTVTYNTDFAVGFVGLMGNPHAIGEAFHITSDEVLTWNQIYETLADALGVTLHPYHVSGDFLGAVGKQFGFDCNMMGDKSVSTVFDNTKLKKAVPEFNATISFAQGARLALDHILSHPDCQIEDPEFDSWCDKVVAAIEKAKAEF